ncbi:hypothetical protein EV714DRAFT_169332, partial [Schizophyllum commune]
VLLPAAEAPMYLDTPRAALGLHVDACASFRNGWLPDYSRDIHVALRSSTKSLRARRFADVSPRSDIVARIFMLLRCVGEVQDQSQARVKASEPVEVWREAVGLDAADALNESPYRVIEWGGME